MSFLSELFNPSFLIFLGILILVISLLFVYFESQSRAQNHKIASMLSLVSSLAEEINGVKIHMSFLSLHGGGSQNASISQNNQQKMNLENQTMILKNNLINVSDDEGESDDEEESDDQGSDDEEEGSDDEEEGSDDLEEDSDDEEKSVINIDESNNIKILKINIGNDNDDDEDDQEELEELEELDDLDDFDENKSSTSEESLSKDNQNSIEKILIVDHDSNLQEIEQLSSSLLDLKTINISSLEESPKELEKIDYKKLPIGKLKSIVVEKGLVTDSSKLKKNELLKLLEDE